MGFTSNSNAKCFSRNRFFTNKKEGAYLNSKKGQQQISSSIVNAILEYKKSLDKNVNDYSIINDTIEPVEPVTDDIIFKVQIAASSKELETKAYNFNGLQDISRLKENGMYKYFYGHVKDYDKTKALEEEAREKGYTSSFIVAFKAGKKIALMDALKTTTN